MPSGWLMMRHLYAIHCGVLPRKRRTMVAKCNMRTVGDCEESLGASHDPLKRSQRPKT